LHELNYLNGLLILNDEEKIMTTIIQGLKIIKHLTRKITTTNERIARWCSYTSDEEPLYTDIDALIQSVGDMQMEICKIRHAIHLANANKVVIFENKETTLDKSFNGDIGWTTSKCRTEVLVIRLVGLSYFSPNKNPYTRI